MHLSKIQLMSIVYEVLRDAGSRMDFGSTVVGSLSERESWIFDEIVSRCEETDRSRQNKIRDLVSRNPTDIGKHESTIC